LRGRHLLHQLLAAFGEQPAQSVFGVMARAVPSVQVAGSAFVLDNFVWDWFFGISMLLAAPIFGGNTLKTALRLVMILSGALCLAGLVWLAVSPAQAIVVGILGWGAAGPIVFLLLANMFGRVQAETREPPAP